MSLERLSSFDRWLRAKTTLLVVFVLSAWALGGPRTEVAQAWIDPWARIPVQDEALYSHSALRMAAGEDWLTPHFLGRKLLVKPPLAMWLSALSQKCFGSLRYPHMAAAAALATLVYHQTGPVGWILLLSRGFWRERAGLVMMDDLLLLFYALAFWQLWKDPRLEGRGSSWIFGIWVGLAILTKWFAGFLPLLLLAWSRPPLRRWVEAGIACAAVSLPWHLYQLAVNPDWFLAEYIGVELLTYAVAAPVQSSAEAAWAFYGGRSLWLAPLAAVALWEYARKREVNLGLVWCAVLVGAMLAYGYHNASYLLPLAPALLLSHRGWIHWAWLPLCVLSAFGPPLDAAARPGNALAGREVLHLDPSDQFRTTLASGATVRYILFLEHLPPNGPLDFEKRGIARSAEAFLKESGPEVDVVLTPDATSLQLLILGSPQRDFLLPSNVWAQLEGSLRGKVPHEVAEWKDRNRVWLRSRNPQPGPRPNRFPSY